MRRSSPHALMTAGLLAFGLGCDTDTTAVIDTVPAPDSLWSISLNSAIHLQWTDNAALSDAFESYRIYSASYDLDLGLCRSDWALEGITVADEFLVARITNGVPLCFAVSAVSLGGYESPWSPLWQDTPRPDARNVLVYAFEANAAQSGFRFWHDANGNGRAEADELGLVQDGSRTDIDFWVHRDATDSTLWFVPEFAGDSMQVYGTAPVPDLTSIDYAPPLGYSRSMFEAVPLWGYVFQRNENDRYTYAGLRVTHVGRQYVIFDFSVQTDPGNPELIVARGGTMVTFTGSQVPGPQ